MCSSCRNPHTSLKSHRNWEAQMCLWSRLPLLERCWAFRFRLLLSDTFRKFMHALKYVIRVNAISYNRHQARQALHKINDELISLTLLLWILCSGDLLQELLNFQIEMHKPSFGFHACTISYKSLDKLPFTLWWLCLPDETAEWNLSIMTLH